MRHHLDRQIWEALSAGCASPVPGACFAFNEAMSSLHEFGTTLLPGIESVLESADFVVAYDSEPTYRKNLSQLLQIYFEIAHDNRIDTVSFLRRMNELIREEALRTIFLTWGPGGVQRRKTISQNLFDYFCECSGYLSHRCEVFHRYRRIGMLSVV